MRVEGNSAWVFFFFASKPIVNWIFSFCCASGSLSVFTFSSLQEPITRSLHINCTLESTLSRIFLFLELRFSGGSLSSCENTLTFRAFRHYCNTFVRPACDLNNKGPQLSYDWLFCKHPRKTPWEVLLKIKWNGTRLTQRASMEDGSSG